MDLSAYLPGPSYHLDLLLPALDGVGFLAIG